MFLTLVWLLLSSLSQQIVSIELPIFDFYQVLHDDRQVVLKQMDTAAQTLGVFVIQNVSRNLLRYPVDGILTSANGLFALSLESKMQMAFNSSHHFGRGYLSFGAESGLSSFFEPKEGYSYGYPLPQDKDYGWLTSANLWPADFSTVDQEVVESVHTDFGYLAQTIVSTLLQHRLSRHQEKVDLSLAGGEKISLMRLFHYFQVSPEEHQASNKSFLGSSPHTDWGLLTVILQNGVSGLQFYHEDRWMDVPTLADSVIINIGDYFSLATGGLYHSPIHRVLCPETEDRLSFVYFYYPSFESKLIRVSADQTCSSSDSSNCEKADKPVSTLEFNTLTVHEDETIAKSDDHSFGDYIMYKWRSVLRQQN